MSRLRQVELIVGPLRDYEGRGVPSNGLRIYSTGRQNELRIQFSVTKTITGAPNKLDLSITNLSDETRNRIRKRLTRVQLTGGYLEGDNAGLRTISTGGVLSVIPGRVDTEIITNISVLDGYGGMTRGVYRQSFGSNVPLSNVVSDIAKSMPGVEVGQVSVPGTLGISGRTFAGRSAELLDNLGDQWGFSWSVQNGVFQAVQDDIPSGVIHTLSYRDGSLREIRPLLTGPFEEQTGVEVVGALNPRIRPGQRIRVESGINPSLNRIYTVHEHDLAGDTHGDEWSSVFRTLFI